MKRRMFITVLGVAMAALVSPAAPSRAGQPPQVRVTNVRRVFHNGRHNAFTDLVRFRDRFYLTFRSCPDGSIIAIGRRGRANAQPLRSQKPYTQWERKELDRYIGGPLLTRWAGRYVVGGRKTIRDKGPVTSLCWLVNDRLYEFAELPSAGDNSYPGLVETGPGRALVSWYSSPEKDATGKPITAIYLADLEVVD